MEYKDFFFSSRRRHTRFDCDWSSDVCSSDLGAAARGLHARTKAVGLLAMDRRRLESALHDGGEEGKAKPEIIADSTIVGHRRNHSPLWITSPDPGKISNRPPAFFPPPDHPSIAPIPMDLLWPSLAAELKKELPAQQYDTWIKPLRAEYQEDQLVLVAPNHHVLRWVRANLLARIESRVERVAGNGASVNLVLDERPAEVEIVMPEAVAIIPERGAREEHRLNPSFTFANFVNGKANQIARAAAIQVAENPGTAYNPLFIYGGTGLGKTHLLQAIGTEVLRRNPRAKVRYVHSEQFVADVVAADQHTSL